MKTTTRTNRFELQLLLAACFFLLSEPALTRLHAQTPLQIAQQAYLKASNAGADNWFGGAVAMSGDTVVVGAYSESSGATGVNGNQSDYSAVGAGAAYVFVRTGTNWVQQAYLKASNTGFGDNFGGAVAVDGDTIVVGAYFEASGATGVNGNQNNNNAPGSGAAYVFVRNGTNWSQQAYLKASHATPAGTDQLFGYSVSVSDDTIVVGALYEDSNATDSGAAYVFVRTGTNWAQQAYLKASNTGENDWFGVSVGVDGDVAIVGAAGESSNAIGVNGNQGNNNAAGAGAAYVFVRIGTNWPQQAYLKASNAGADDLFGVAVAVAGETVIVGAPGEASNATGINGNQSNNSATNAGATYVFVRDGTNWAQQAYLKASNSRPDNTFGNSVAISGDTIVVGAGGEASNASGVNGNQANNNATNSGAAYAFAREGTNWMQLAYLKASNTGAGDAFGGTLYLVGVAVSGNTLAIGAPLEDSNATGVNEDQGNNNADASGAAYVFTWFGVASGPSIVTQPVAQQVFTGASATFTVSATTANPPLSYQWRFNGADLPGATNVSLTITNVQVANLGSYQVLVADSVGSVSSALVSLSFADTMQTLYETSFEAPTFTADSPIRGQDGWEMFYAAFVSTNNPNTGNQCLQVNGARMVSQPDGTSVDGGLLSPQSLALRFGSNRPTRVELECDVRLDGPPLGTSGTPDFDLISANFFAGSESASGSNYRRLGGFYVSAAGRIWTVSEAPGEKYKYSVPYTLGTYRHLTLHVDMIARTITYFVDGVELGSSPFDPANTDTKFSLANVTLIGATLPVHTAEIDYNRTNYQAYFDDYRIAELKLPAPELEWSFIHSNATLHLTSTAVTGHNYALQTSETLTNWTTLTTRRATTNRVDFTDTTTGAPFKRFYRVKQD